jgi:hypothetical protein
MSRFGTRMMIMRPSVVRAVVVGVLLGGMTVLACSKDEVGEIHHQEGVVMPEDYAGLLDKIDRIENEIRQHPTDVNLRAELVAASVDTAARLIRAVGRGLPAELAKRSRPLALQSAERASVVDAYRWVAYLMKWTKDHRFPDYGAIEASVPGVRIVLRDTLANDEIRLLVEADLR